MRAVLTDFGLSKTASTISELSAIDSAFTGGTNAWKAPELFSCDGSDSDSDSNSDPPFTHKSDVYSYSIVIWEVLCGAYPKVKPGRDPSNMPWFGKDAVKIAFLVASGKRPELPDAAITDSNVLHAAEWVDIMQQCGQTEPNDRPSFHKVKSITSGRYLGSQSHLTVEIT
jgi:serine/threonine protein kinase